MKILVYISYLAIILLSACGMSAKKPKSSELIVEPIAQDSIFKNLVNLTHASIPENIINDSLAFLILPVHATCPFCRKKTIDSILQHQSDLANRHFIIISANGGRKTINSFFRERGKELPVMKDRFFLDSTNQAYKYNLYDDKPTMYYTHNRKAYKKIASLPATVMDDLHQFFSEEHKNKQVAKKN